MNDTEKLIVLADSCSDLLYGGERGWEDVEFDKFVADCRKAIAAKTKLKMQLNDQLNDCINFDGGKLTDCIMKESSRLLKAV